MVGEDRVEDNGCQSRHTLRSHRLAKVHARDVSTMSRCCHAGQHMSAADHAVGCSTAYRHYYYVVPLWPHGISAN